MLWLFALACTSAPPGHRVQGVVVEVTANDEVLVDHEAIEGFMDAMTMPFHVKDPSLLEGLEPGHRIEARLEIGESGGFLTRLEVVGKGPAPEAPVRPPSPLRPGAQLPSTPVHYADGSDGVIGEGQGYPLVLTFLYTRCPMPEFCPATVAKLAAIQEASSAPLQMLAITLDPEHDTDEVLSVFAEQAGAGERWKFGRVEDLDALALFGGLTFLPKDGEILHSKRVLLIDAQGKLVKRYDDLAFQASEAVRLLEGS